MSLATASHEESESILSTEKSLQCQFFVLLLIWKCSSVLIKLPLVQWQSLFITPRSFFFLVVASSHYDHNWTSFPHKEADWFWNPLKIKTDWNFLYLRLPRWMSELSEMKSELPCKARSLWGVISIFTGRCPALVVFHPLFWGRVGGSNSFRSVI